VMDAGALAVHIREHFNRTAFRLETRQQYEVASDGSDFARYLAGEPGPTPERKQPWLDRLRSERERGLHRSRVRIVTHPVTEYTRFECEWGYAPNEEAGEHVSILDVAESAASEEAVERMLRCGDFWLLDDIHVVVMHYGPDGQFVGAERADNATPYQDIARLARTRAEPFAVWWARHEEYHRDPKVE
jgi:uncharacterized protein DUF6879